MNLKCPSRTTLVGIKRGVRKWFIWAYLTKGPMLLGIGVEDALWPSVWIRGVLMCLQPITKSPAQWKNWRLLPLPPQDEAWVQSPNNGQIISKPSLQLMKTHIHAGRCSTPRTGKEKSNKSTDETHIHAGRCSTPRTGKENSNKST